MLGESLVSKLPFLERDIRRLVPELAVKEAEALSLAPHISILEEGGIGDLGRFDEVVIADDDIGRFLEEKGYLEGRNVTKDTAFLRWHSMNAVTKTPVTSDASITSADLDRKFMSMAESESKKSSDWWRRVGAALVKDGMLIASAYNKHAVTEHSHYIDGEPRSNFNAGQAIAELVIFQHGEATLIANAARDGMSTKGAEIYVTVFPCPTCAMSIANAGIKKVYYREGYSLLDAERILKNAGVELVKVV